MTRKTAVAAAAMSVASLVSATFALATTMDLPILGFGHDRHTVTTTETADSNDALTTTTAPVEPTVVEQVVYQDVYQRVARPVAPPAAVAETPASSTPPAPTQPAPATTVSTTTRPTTTTTPTTTIPATTAPTTTRAVTTTRPAPPPNCLEPEWDRELQRWHCKGN